MRKSSPAWSLRGRAPAKIDLKVLPGPGAYDPKANSREYSPKWSASKALRLPRFSTCSPGPGAYHAVYPSTSPPKTSFGTSKRTDLSAADKTPGPGAYVIKEIPEGPSFSLFPRREAKERQGPGPGAYTPKLVDKIPIYSISKAKRLKNFLKDTPGPGEYSMSPTKDSPQWKIGTQKRMATSSSIIPGPGSYNNLSRSVSPSVSLKSRHVISLKDCSPGPAAYSPGTSSKSIKYSLGHSAKLQLKPEKIPGPGSYTPVLPVAKGIIFGKTARITNSPDADLPGPGSYEAKPTMTGPKFSLSCKLVKKFIEIPGPGAYNPVHVFKKEPEFKIGTQARGYLKKIDTPGPGTYETSSKDNGPKWKLYANDKSIEHKSRTPGPGEYNIPATVPNPARY